MQMGMDPCFHFLLLKSEKNEKIRKEKNLGAGQVAKKLNLINKEGKFYSGQFS